ncbi:hypothetical protein ABS71_02755 [bacterium SCN 62-11]|nr:MAG: hypothetical protein ABS71_02755 [bacterium SCN 62-11]
MTGLLDKDAFRTLLEEEVRRAVRFERPLTLLVASWSHQGPQSFDKRTVKSYGAVRQLATIIKKGLRDVDAAGRLDGEVLAALLPETDLAGARVAAQRICREAEGHEFAGETLDDRIQLAVNVAIVSHPDHGNDARALMSQARAALERAQTDGYSLVYEAAL